MTTTAGRPIAVMLSGWRGGATAVALGVAAAAGQAPLGLWWVTLAALAGFCAVLLLAGAGARRGFVLGWALGLGHFAAALFWIVEPFFVDPVRHGWMAPFALVLLPGGLALFWGLAGAFAGRLGGRRGVLAWPVALGLAELARGHLLGGFPWAQVGHVWIDTPVAQLAALIGASGLTAVTLALSAWPALGWGLRGRAGAWAGAALAGVTVAGVWVWGADRLAAPLPDPAIDLRLRLVQPNAPQHLKWRPDMVAQWFDRHLEFTAAAPRTGQRRPDLVIWSETAIPWLLEDAGIAFEMAAEAAQGAQIALGLNRLEGWDPRNALAVLDADGAVSAVYDKHHLVPFGEYIPLAEYLAGTRLGGLAARQLTGFAPGPGPVLLDLGPLGHAAPMICYEAVFPRHLAAIDRPDWVLQATNDAWFGRIAGPYQHLAQARFRAVEFGLPVVRAANTGVSAVIDGRGQVVAALALNTAGWLDADLPAALPPTPFALWGELPLTGLLAVLSALLAATGRRGRQHRD